MRLAIAPGGELAGNVVLDPNKRMQGRGAYLCRAADADAPAPACLRSALRRGAIARTLRTRTAIEPKLVESTDGA